MAQARPPLAYLSEITPQPTLPTIAAMGDQLNPYGLGTALPTAENITAELVRNRPDSTMRAYEPNWKDRWGARIAGDAGAAFGPQRRNLAEKVLGSSGLGGGEDRMSLADLAGVTGAVNLGKGIVGDRETLLSGAADVGSNFMPLGKLAIFAGVGAKTANRALLETAKDLAEHGLPRASIWDSTGWFQGADKKWRFEIPDDRSHFKGTARLSDIVNQRGNTAKEVFYHQPAYKAYPELGDIEISPTAEGATKGTYELGDPAMGYPTLIRVRDMNTPGTHGTLLHEMQHGVQDLEGFAQGANPAQFAREYKSILNDYNAQIEAINGMLPSAAGTPRYNELMEMRSELAKTVRDIEGPHGIGVKEKSNDRYRRHAGEVEARNVQARQFMTPEARRAKPPWETQDIPDEDQIVRFR